MHYSNLRLFVFSLLLISGAVFALSLENVPSPAGYVSDFAGVLSSSEKSGLETLSSQIEQNTSVEIATVIIDTTDGMPISDYAISLGNKWKVGKKETFNGVVILIAINDRDWFIATAKGIEGDLPDVLTNRIAQESFPQNFRQEKYFEGISEGLFRIWIALGGDISSAGYGVSSGTETVSKPAAPFDDEFPMWPFAVFFMGFPVFFILIFLMIAYFMYKAAKGEKKGKIFGIPWSMHSGNSWGRNGGFGGGGFGGGGFGGFGGGGGFSGGGSGGHW